MITVVFGLVRYQLIPGRLLLLQRAFSDSWCPGLWSFPGGKVDDNESLHDAMERELFEETNLMLAVSTCTLLPDYIDKAPYRFHFFDILTSGSLHLSKEHVGFGWFLPQSFAIRDDLAEIVQLAAHMGYIGEGIGGLGSSSR